MDKQKKTNKQGLRKKKKRVYISSLATFRREQKYLPLFAAFCEHKKRYYQAFRLILWIDGMKNFPICSRKACKRPFCLFAACLWLANRLGLCKYRQAQRKSLKTPGNSAYRRFFANHPPGRGVTR